ncbi:MAG: response regulator transcription factor [Bacteroidales bacterium]|nr:response regulator transcription factor [Bacteroidales bacterium]
MEIRVVIIDDEEEARDVMDRLLHRLGGINIAGKAANVDEGLDLILSEQPDIVFLDIQMPGKDGFELVKKLRDYNLTATIVFTTAHIEYAVNAMKVAAFDYLLKPVVFEVLKETVQRFRCQRSQQLNAKVDVLLDALYKPEKICFNTRTGYIYIAPEDIIYCQADVNYTEIYFGKERKEVVTVNIGKVNELLDLHKFYRISRSHLINTKYLAKADRRSKSCELLKNEEKFTIPAPSKQIRLMEAYLSSGKN